MFFHLPCELCLMNEYTAKRESIFLVEVLSLKVAWGRRENTFTCYESKLKLEKNFCCTEDPFSYVFNVYFMFISILSFPFLNNEKSLNQFEYCN